MTKKNGLSWSQLQILAIIARERHPDGWFYQGSQFIADELAVDKEFVQDKIRQMLHDKVLEEPKVIDPRRKVIPLRQTKDGYELRITSFGRLFPDIKSVLLRK